MKPRPRTYGAADLWEFIDGAADTYLACGFQEVVTSEYSNQALGAQVAIDIYRMNDSRSAFGVYSQEANPEYEFRAIGVEGYLGGTVLNFWSGPYYVKLTTFTERDDLKQEMTRLAEAVSLKLGDPGVAPVEVGYFPRENMVPHSVRYLATNVLGQSYLSGGFEASYRDGAKESALVFVALASPEAAREALSRYRQHVASATGSVEDLKSPADGGFSGLDEAHGIVVAVRAGSRLAVAAGVPWVDAALPRIRALLAKSAP
jgi:hypothetical protein